MKQGTKDILFLLLLVGVVIFMVFAMFYMIKNKIAFFDHPLRYYGEKKNVDCECVCNGKFNLNFNSTSVKRKPLQIILGG